MSRTYNSIRQVSIKRKLTQRRIELGTFDPKQNPLHATESDMTDPIIMKLLDQFWKGPIRLGNNRRYDALMKVKTRKSERQKLKKEIEL